MLHDWFPRVASPKNGEWDFCMKLDIPEPTTNKDWTLLTEKLNRTMDQIIIDAALGQTND